MSEERESNKDRVLDRYPDAECRKTHCGKYCIYSNLATPDDSFDNFSFFCKTVDDAWQDAWIKHMQKTLEQINGE